MSDGKIVAIGGQMTLNGYQFEAERTLAYTPNTMMDLMGRCLGLTGEAGEVADYVKKVAIHGRPLDPEYLVKELGDVLWYVSAVSSWLGVSLNDIATGNIEKLKKRYPEGFVPDSQVKREPEG